jgi:CheY-like chemotaxis protein
MAALTTRRKQVLLVDDDQEYLRGVRDIFAQLSHGTWEIRTAHNHAQALAQLKERRTDLIVLDIGMPVVDGIQFLRLLNRAHPGQQVVMLTGVGSEARRQECLANGALLFLDKPTAPGGYESIYAALDPLVSVPASEGFRGVMRQVALPEVLQMECLGKKSSVLEIFTSRVRGRIYVYEGAVIHAEEAGLQGEVALYSLLALRGGEFNLLPFTEPPRRTIEGQWEFLLMEAARLQDENAQADGVETEPLPEFDAIPSEVAAPDLAPVAAPTAIVASVPGPAAAEPGSIEPSALPEVDQGLAEVFLCSGAGEVLHQWQCESASRRLELLEAVEDQATQLNSFAPFGRFDRLEMDTNQGRTVCQILPDRRLFVRSNGGVA